MDFIQSQLKKIDRQAFRENLFYLAQDPLPCRTLNCTLPGHTLCTLYEADQFITRKLESWGYSVERETMKVQAFQPDPSVPHGFRKPLDDAPWYDAFNLIARKTGSDYPKELIVVISHKDSQSWLSCAAGAHDNAVGVAANLEIARILSEVDSRRSIRFVFCNEEHWPWTSALTARNIRESGISLIAALNVDSIAGKSAADQQPGRLLNVTRYTTPEGERLADLMAFLNESYQLGLIQRKHFCEYPNDDDGSFVKAGLPAAVLNIGSFPYAEPYYHTLLDVPENVDLENALLPTQLTLAAVLHLDALGQPD